MRHSQYFCDGLYDTMFNSKGENKWLSEKAKKLRFLRKSNNKIDDTLHKYVTGLVVTQKRKGVTTLVIRNYHQDLVGSLNKSILGDLD